MRRRWTLRGLGDEATFTHRAEIAFGLRPPALGGASAIAEANEAWRRLRTALEGRTDRDGREREIVIDMLAAAGHARLDLARTPSAALEPLLREAVLHGTIVLVRPTRQPDRAAREAPPAAPPQSSKLKPARPLTWVGLEVAFEDGTPYTGAYKVKLPDGGIRTGTLSQEGTLYFDGIAPGDCEIAFPNLASASR